EVAMASRLRSGWGACEAHRALEVLALEKKLDRPDQVDLADPGDVLPAVAEGPAEAVLDQPDEPVEDASAVRAHGEAETHRDLPRPGHRGARERELPGARAMCSLDIKLPFRRRVRSECARHAGDVPAGVRRID